MNSSAVVFVPGFPQIGAESGWRTANTESIKKAAAEASIELKFSDAQQKRENQIKAIRSFIAQKVDVIGFPPVVESCWGTVLREAKAAKIPVILTDRAVDEKDDRMWVTFMGSEFIEEGRSAGRWLLENGKGKEVMEAFLKAEGKKSNVLYAHNDGMAIKTRDADTPIGQLSGGNPQQAILARWLTTEPRLLMLDEPTRGIDISVGAVVAIAAPIAALRVDGAPVHEPRVPMALALLAAASACGLWNGWLVAGVGLQPIIAMLIPMVAGRGVAQLITGSQIITVSHPPFFVLGNGHLLGLPVSMFIAAVVIGGTLLSGGTGHVIGTLFGMLILGLIQTVISFDGTLSSWWTRIVIGALLLVFCLLQRLMETRRR